MKETDIERLIDNMIAAGCSTSDTERVRKMHEAGMEQEILTCLRRCRCDLMGELHETQRKVDRMDQIIRSRQSSI